MMTIRIEYEYQKCPSCGVHYAVDADVMVYKRQCTMSSSNRNWYCPNGHSLVCRESEADKQRQRAERAEQQVAYHRNRADTAERSVSAHKGQITKLRKRAKAGVCICCNRTFQNLAWHMASKHPDMNATAPLEVIAGGKP